MIVQNNNLKGNLFQMQVSKEILAVFITAWLAVEGWGFLKIFELSNEQAQMSVQITEINKAVNNVKAGDPTLVMMVEELLEISKAENE